MNESMLAAPLVLSVALASSALSPCNSSDEDNFAGSGEGSASEAAAESRAPVTACVRARDAGTCSEHHGGGLPMADRETSCTSSGGDLEHSTCPSEGAFARCVVDADTETEEHEVFYAAREEAWARQQCSQLGGDYQTMTTP